MTTRSMITLLAGAAAAAISVSAQAATISQTVNFGTQLTDWNQSGTFNLFDTSLGTLNSITLSDAYNISTTLSVKNSGNESSSGTVAAKSKITLGALDSGQNAAIAALLVNSTIFTDDVAYTLAVGQEITGIAGTAAGSKGPVTTTNNGYLASFSMLGGGTGTVTASTFTNTVLSNNGGNTSAVQVTNGNGSFTIVYNYDVAEVPEPAMLGLFGLGAVGLGLSRRRKAA